MNNREEISAMIVAAMMSNSFISKKITESGIQNTEDGEGVLRIATCKVAIQYADELISQLSQEVKE